MRIAIACLMTVCVAAVVTVSADEPEIDLQKNVVYGQVDDRELTLHLAKPKNLASPAPVIVYIHGGGWRMGDKDQHLQQIQQAAKQGYVSVSVGYRLAPKYLFPAQVEDVKCAVRWLRAHAEELNIDPQRIGAIGYSAGAHLSMMLGTMDPGDGLEGDGPWQDQSSKVQAVVSYFGPTNLQSEYPAVTKAIFLGFLGGMLEEKRDEYRLASPITYVNAGDAPTLMFQGTKDVLVPYEQAFEMCTALSQAGVPGRVEILLGAGHGWAGEQFEQTQRTALEFFDQHLRK